MPKQKYHFFIIRPLRTPDDIKSRSRRKPTDALIRSQQMSSTAFFRCPRQQPTALPYLHKKASPTPLCSRRS
ncbi:MAG: hypothetical protein IJV33_10685 [Bacteroidaceae bacterium]|nr:hypothetical protein [Bacteroidaceae bacterium]